MSKITINDEFLSNVNDKLSNVNDKIKQLGTYSTDETDTGMTWINGEKIYRKVIYSTVDKTDGDISTGLPSDVHIIRAWGIAKMKGSQIWLPLNFYNSGGWNSFHIINNTIHSQRDTQYSIDYAYYVLEYIK